MPGLLVTIGLLYASRATGIGRRSARSLRR
jgi:hypothetical protein